MHLKSHVIMKLALGLTVGATASACQKSRQTIDNVPHSTATEANSVLPMPLPYFQYEAPQDEVPDVVTVEAPTPEPKAVETVDFHGDDCPFCGMG